MFKKDDLHIAILKYGRDEAEKGILFEELKSHIKDKGYDISEARLKAYFGETYEAVDLSKRVGSYDDRANERSSLTIESTFRLIEYEEFKNANSNSFRASVFAIIAIVISIITTSISICYSEKQLNSDVSINKSQISEIKSMKYNDKEIANKLDEMNSKMEILIKQTKPLEKFTSEKNK